MGFPYLLWEVIRLMFGADLSESAYKSITKSNASYFFNLAFYTSRSNREVTDFPL
jgi:hypothetical protein